LFGAFFKFRLGISGKLLHNSSFDKIFFFSETGHIPILFKKRDVCDFFWKWLFTNNDIS